ncbi:MAG TPA: biotin/lipoyl-containing protein, partial [Acidimicrobiales bacterium]|nr:biotin/lipoyl-containing protein [Acidimicrobiales bacterium]
MAADPEHDDLISISAPMAATVAAVRVADGDHVLRGATVMVLEVMKMEHLITAPVSGRIRCTVGVGDTVVEHQSLASIEPGIAAGGT